MKRCLDCYHLCSFGDIHNIETEVWCASEDGRNYPDPYDEACDAFIDVNDKDAINEYENKEKEG